MNLAPCLVALALYLGIVISIGVWTRRRACDPDSFFYAHRSLPLLAVAASFLAANSGALDALGLAAMAAQYGVQAFHFFWIGAIPAMVFSSLWLMPLYRRSGVLNLPEWLELRFGPRMRLLNTCLLLVMLPLLAGIGLYAASLLLETLTGISFVAGVCIAAAVVLAFVLLGGIRATIYTEILQLLLMVIAFAPLMWRAALHHALFVPGQFGSKAHLWTSLPLVQPHAALDVAGVVLGLGFVLSFGYWCTDFVLMQRAFAVRSDDAAQRVPLLAGFGKLLFSMLIVLPGLAPVGLLPGLGTTLRFDQALPALMRQTYGPILMALGFTAIAAGLTSNLGANVTACGALFTSGLYRRYLAPDRSDRHYMFVGRTAVVIAMAISLGASFLSFHFGNLMEQIQWIFSTFGAPFWAVFLLGLFTVRVGESAALSGFLSGTVVAILHNVTFRTRYIHYGSIMSSNFYSAIYSFSCAIAIATLGSRLWPKKPEAAAVQHTIRWSDMRSLPHSRGSWMLAALLLATCAALNYWWR